MLQYIYKFDPIADEFTYVCVNIAYFRPFVPTQNAKTGGKIENFNDIFGKSGGKTGGNSCSPG